MTVIPWGWPPASPTALGQILTPPQAGGADKGQESAPKIHTKLSSPPCPALPCPELAVPSSPPGFLLEQLFSTSEWGLALENTEVKQDMTLVSCAKHSLALKGSSRQRHWNEKSLQGCSGRTEHFGTWFSGGIGRTFPA